MPECMTLNDSYFQWLKSILIVDKADSSYYLLVSKLNRMEFYALLDDDYNRADDGVDLRRDFVREVDGNPTEYHNLIYKGPCTVLEALIGLAKRIDYDLYMPEEGSQVELYFWELVQNLGLDRFDDKNYVDLGSDDAIVQIIDTWLSRKYHRDGIGSPFPIKSNSHPDMRTISINEMKNLYLMERSR